MYTPVLRREEVDLALWQKVCHFKCSTISVSHPQGLFTSRKTENINWNVNKWQHWFMYTKPFQLSDQSILVKVCEQIGKLFHWRNSFGGILWWYTRSRGRDFVTESCRKGFGTCSFGSPIYKQFITWRIRLQSWICGVNLAVLIWLIKFDVSCERCTERVQWRGWDLHVNDLNRLAFLHSLEGTNPLRSQRSFGLSSRVMNCLWTFMSFFSEVVRRVQLKTRLCSQNVSTWHWILWNFNNANSSHSSTPVCTGREFRPGSFHCSIWKVFPFHGLHAVCNVPWIKLTCSVHIKCPTACANTCVVAHVNSTYNERETWHNKGERLVYMLYECVSA